MAELNVSLAFFCSTFVACEAARRACRWLLPAGTCASLAQEAVGAAQLAACCLELRVLVELGPWVAGLGADLLLTLLFLLCLGHGVSLDRTWANPTVALQDLLLVEVSLPSTLLRLVAQALGMAAACILTQLCWSWELSSLHLFQKLLASECSSTLRTSVPHGALVEGACALCFHLTLLRFRSSPPVHRVPAIALLLTVLGYIAGPFTSAFFNPTLASVITFSCSGNTLLEYIQVYWLGPLAGMVLAVLLHQGNLPWLFQRNLLYRQKSKHRTPRGKPAPVPGQPTTTTKGQSPGDTGGRSRAGRPLCPH
ncbi:PREDICTED: aquaporin-12B [Elephantulus edwardii]|uniref:aquaporin-12B n=1 Tax=Elephantulus edwardii TaxID=28737 RepID=UPI0003F0F15F|nr:PREDICTED: aquaporin-12B [Elephantulus edwardii]